MTEPVCVQKAPYACDLEPGSYWWCACGLSKNQPFCDGSHKGTDINPVEHKVTAKSTVWFCGCKRTSGPPLCDGTHGRL